MYGYYCEHYYGNNALKNMVKGKEESVLRGKDFELFHAAKKMGIKELSVKILYDVEDPYDYEEDESGNELAIQSYFVGPPS